MSKKVSSKNKMLQEGNLKHIKVDATTQIIDDVFTDEISRFKPKFEVDFDAYLQRLWASNPEIYQILKSAADVESARESMYIYLEKAE
jgi:hypothetical protein